MNHDTIRDQLEEYALDLLDVDEHEQVERHLAECPDCRLELTRIHDQLSRLPEALVLASGEAPPEVVKERLLQTVQSDSVKASQRRDRPTVRRTRTWWTPARVVAMVGIVALTVSIGWGFRLNQALSEERELRTRIANLVDQQELVLEIVDGSDTVRRVLRSPEGGDAYGKIFTRSGFEEVVIMAARLPDVPEGTSYHVWLTAHDRTQLAGTLKVNEEGFGLLVIEAGDGGADYSSAQVTVQPEGSTEPGGTVVLTWAEE